MLSQFWTYIRSLVYEILEYLVPIVLDGTLKLIFFIQTHIRKLTGKIKNLEEWTKWSLIMFFVWLFSILIIINIPIETSNIDSTKYLYLLSALAQSLAAIFAFVFTISLIVAQLSSRYSHRILTNYFDRITICYICLFIFSILLSFWVLTNLKPFWIKFSLIVAAIAFYGLIPYFLRFKNQLNPQFIVDKLREKAEEKILKDSINDPEEISTIDNYIMSAYVLKDYNTYNAAINSLNRLIIIILEKRRKNEKENNDTENDNLERLFTLIIRRLRDIGITTIEDPRAPISVITSISRNATRTSLYNLDHYGTLACDCLGTIGIKAAKKGLPDLLLNPAGGVINEFIYIGNIAVKSNMVASTLYVGINLARVGKEAAHSKLSGISYAAADCIKQLTDGSMENNLVNPTTGINISAPLTYEIGGIGIESIENHQEETTANISELLSKIGVKASSKKLEDTSIKASESLRILGMKSCQKELEISLRTITKCLYDIGVESMFKELEETLTSIADSLFVIAIESHKKVGVLGSTIYSQFKF